MVADPDGAAAFIRHYFAVANYAYETGDVEALHPTRHDGCTACKSLEKTVQDGFADGGHIEGGRIGVGDVVVTPGYADIGLEAKAVLNQSEGALVSASGDVIDRIPAEEQLLIGLLLKYQDGWSIVQWGKPDAPQ